MQSLFQGNVATKYVKRIHLARFNDISTKNTDSCYFAQYSKYKVSTLNRKLILN